MTAAAIDMLTHAGKMVDENGRTIATARRELYTAVEAVRTLPLTSVEDLKAARQQLEASLLAIAITLTECGPQLAMVSGQLAGVAANTTADD